MTRKYFKHYDYLLFADDLKIVMPAKSEVDQLLLREESSIIWSPYYNIHINTLEKLENRFLRYCAFKLYYGIEDNYYSSIIKELNLSILKTCRTINDK